VLKDTIFSRAAHAETHIHPVLKDTRSRPNYRIPSSLELLTALRSRSAQYVPYQSDVLRQAAGQGLVIVIL